MKIKTLSLITLASILGSASLLAVTSPQTVNTQAAAVSAPQFETVAFKDSKEADMLHRAYHILATGDHDYHGHRMDAMKQIHKAADLLGVDLTGDDKDHEKQVLSDDRLREAKGLLQNVLGASEVKSQKHISHHIEEAIKQINTALKVH